MWKKFVVYTTALAVLLTNSIVAFGATDYISDLDVSETSFNPSVGEDVEIEFDLLQDAEIHSYIINSDDEFVVTFQDNVATPAQNNIEYTWYGTTGNTEDGSELPDGLYQLFVFAKDGNSVLDFSQETIEINNVVDGAPIISDLELDIDEFTPDYEEATEISFEVDRGSYITVIVREEGDDEDDEPVYVFEGGASEPNYDGTEWFSTDESPHSLNWFGLDQDGDLVDAGTYVIYVTAENDEGSNTRVALIEITENTNSSDGVIEDVELDPSRFWDPNDEDLVIKIDLEDDVKSLIVDAKQGNQVIEILDDDFADDGDYIVEWDGTDEDGDYVDSGVWEIIVRADSDKVVKTIEVEYERSVIVDAFVTKTSFDPSEDERAVLLFKADASAEVTVDVFDGSRKEITLVKEENIRRNKWYAVVWDGKDDDGDEVNFGKAYKFRISTENATEDDIGDYTYVEVNVENDEVSNSTVNVTNDEVEPVVVNEDDRSPEADFNFCIEDDAEIFLAVYEGLSSTGDEEAELVDYEDFDEGCHTLRWNVEDEDGKLLDDGVYTYKLISRDGSRKDTEVGRFIIGSEGDIDYTNDDDEDEDDDKFSIYRVDGNDNDDEDDFDGVACYNYYWDLSYLDSDNELCEAISWATEEGIFSGNPDGSFDPYRDINRAETLKTILRAHEKVVILPLDGTNLGFADVDAFGWYMPYVRTAMFFGMFNGDGVTGDARLADSVNRAEILKLALEASRSFTGYELVNGYYYGSYDDTSSAQWFYNYANTAYELELFNAVFVGGQEMLQPNRAVQRGEVALLLYRMEKAGLLQ